jgi:hypothetical protein
MRIVGEEPTENAAAEISRGPLPERGDVNDAVQYTSCTLGLEIESCLLAEF